MCWYYLYSRHKNKFEERSEILQIAESIVAKKFDEGDKRYYLYVDIDEGKINGKFDKEDIYKQQSGETILTASFNNETVKNPCLRILEKIILELS